MASLSDDHGAILSWLSNLDMGKDLMEWRSKRIEGTAEWILQTPEFTRWALAQDQSRMLWCHGLPGSGLTTLFSVVVDHFRRTFISPESAIAYIYCDDEGFEQSRYTALMLLSTMCRQLAEQSRELPLYLLKLYKQSTSHGDKIGIDEVTHLLVSLCNSFVKVVICIDAPGSLRKGETPILLSKLKWMSNHGALIFITNCTHGDLPEACLCHEHLIETFQDEAKLLIRAKDEDVRACVRQRLEHHADKDELNHKNGEAAAIIDDLVANSGGMFPVAFYKLDKELRRRKNQRLEIEALLEDPARHLASDLHFVDIPPWRLDDADLIPYSPVHTSSSRSSSESRRGSRSLLPQPQPPPPPGPPPPGLPLTPLGLPPPPHYVPKFSSTLPKIPLPTTSSCSITSPPRIQISLSPPSPSSPLPLSSSPDDSPVESIPPSPGLSAASASYERPVATNSGHLPPPPPGIGKPYRPRPTASLKTPAHDQDLNPDLSHLTSVYPPPKLPVTAHIPPSLGFCQGPSVSFPSLSARTSGSPPFPLSSIASEAHSFPTWKRNPELRAFALKLLGWIVYTKEPLTLAELVQAVTIDAPELKNPILIRGPEARVQGYNHPEPWRARERVSDDQTSPDDEYLDFEHMWDSGISLVDICKGWIRVQPDTQEVHLADTWWKWSLSSRVADRIFPDMHSRIAAACLKFLARAEVLVSNQVPQEKPAAKPFVAFKRYAERFWVAHYLEGGNEKLDELVVSYLRLTYTIPASWVEERRPMWNDKYYVIVTDDETPVLKAARLGLNSVLEKLIRARSYNINAMSFKQESAISVAVAAGYTSTVQLLYRYGASIHYHDSKGWGLLHMAAERDDDVMVVLLLWCGLLATTLSKGHRSEEPLVVAANANSANAAAALLDHGASISTAGIMDAAARKGHEKFVRLLVERGWDLSASTTTKSSPLSDAVSSGSLRLVDYMLSHGASACGIDDEGIHPAIHKAATDGHLEILKLLLDHGADPWRVRRIREGVSKSFERTAIEEAMWGHNPEVVDFLLSRMPHDLPGLTKLEITKTAIESKYPEVFNLMLERLVDGAQPEEMEKYEESLITVAVLRNSEETLNLLLDRGFRLDFVNEHGSSPLHIAASSGTADIASILLERGGDMYGINKEGKSCIGIAARACNVEFLKVLLKWNKQPRLLTEDDSVIIETAESGSSPSMWKEVVRLLLDHGAFVDSCNSGGETALHYAVLDSDVSLVNDLLDHHINSSIMSQRAGSALHLAAFKGNLDIVTALVCHGAIIDLAYNYEGENYKAASEDTEFHHRPHDWGPIEKQWMPLHSAACSGHDDIASFLVEQGAQISPKSLNGDTPLHVAASAGEPGIVKILLQHGADASEKQNAGNTPLHSVASATMATSIKTHQDHFLCNCKRAKQEREAAKLPPTRRWIDCVAILIDNGADLDMENSEGLTPLALAVCCDNHEVVKAFIDHIPSNMYTSAAYLKLLNACLGTTSATTLETISKLFQETKESREVWNKVLIAACDAGNSELVELALEKGARAGLTTTDGTYLLHQAIVNERSSIARSLLLFGADLNLTNSLGRNALHVASAHRGERTLTVNFEGTAKESIAQNLLKEGAQVNSRTQDGDTALHFAVSTGVSQLVGLLIRAGASVDVRNRRGLTPLHAAVSSWIFPDIMEILLQNGACPSAQDSAGFTPMHLIRESWESGGRAVDVLARNGGDCSIRARNGDMPIHCATRRANLTVVEHLLDAGASILDRGANGRSVLHIAAKHNKESMIDRLINLGADPGAVDDDGWTPLHHAANGQHTTIVSILIELTPKIGSQPTGIRPVPLSKALGHGNMEIAKILLDAGFDIERG